MAKLTFETDLCKGCGLCVNACPKGCLTIASDKINKKGYSPAVMADEEKCIGCAFCATMCPDCIINNSNLGSETTLQTVLDSVPYIQTLSKLSGLPIFLHTATIEVAGGLEGKLSPVLPLTLQEKYFDLPTQKPANRPLWG